MNAKIMKLDCKWQTLQVVWWSWKWRRHTLAFFFSSDCPRQGMPLHTCVPRTHGNGPATPHPTHCWSHHMSWCATAVFVSAEISCRISAQLERRNGNHLSGPTFLLPVDARPFSPCDLITLSGRIILSVYEIMSVKQLHTAQVPNHVSILLSSDVLGLPAQKGREKICCTYAQHEHMSFLRRNYQRKWSYINYNLFFFKCQTTWRVYIISGDHII